MANFWDNFKHALRMFRANPGFTFAAVAALALGIGINTAIFTVVDAVLLKPLTYPAPDRIVQFLITSPQGDVVSSGMSIPDFVLFEQQTSVFQDVAAYDWGGPGYNLKKVVPVLDFLNIMTYDCAGPWTDDAQLNSPIFWDWHDPEPYECQPGGSVQEAITAFLRFAPAAKINMGTPFYGYDYETVTALWQSCTHCDFSVLGENYGTFIKQRVNKGGWVRYYDSIAGVPYLLHTKTPGYITYDDPSSTYLRVWYTDWERGLGGTFMWSLDADYDGTSQDLLNAMYDATLNNPSGATQ